MGHLILAVIGVQAILIVPPLPPPNLTLVVLAHVAFLLRVVAVVEKHAVAMLIVPPLQDQQQPQGDQDQQQPQGDQDQQTHRLLLPPVLPPPRR